MIAFLCASNPAISADTDPSVQWQQELALAALSHVPNDDARLLSTLWRDKNGSEQMHLGPATRVVLQEYIASHAGDSHIWSDDAEMQRFQDAVSEQQFDAYLNSFDAPNPVAKALKRAQIRYMAIAEAGGWEKLPAGKALLPLQTDPRIPALRQRLAATNDLPLPPESLDSPIYDERLVEAVKGFQTRHNLPADGIVGKRTLSALNVPVHKRIDSIRLSRSRAQELPQGRFADYVWVNIAGAQTHLVRDQQTVWNGRSVVGKTETQTPEINSSIQMLVLNPFWLVPSSIAQRSLLPRQARDPGFFARMQYQAYNQAGKRVPLSSVDWPAVAQGTAPAVRLMQRPGPKNALGKVKFLFPNKHAVFLHDTPYKSGFAQNQRTLSNGCVRVQDALSLAEKILEPQGWDRASIDRQMATGKPLKLVLDKPLAVHTLYLTANVDADGTVLFYNDSYKKDTPSALASLL